jgi:hypothetical protein
MSTKLNDELNQYRLVTIPWLVVYPPRRGVANQPLYINYYVQPYLSFPIVQCHSARNMPIAATLSLVKGKKFTGYLFAIAPIKSAHAIKNKF